LQFGDEGVSARVFRKRLIGVGGGGGETDGGISVGRRAARSSGARNVGIVRDVDLDSDRNVSAGAAEIGQIVNHGRERTEPWRRDFDDVDVLRSRGAVQRGLKRAGGGGKIGRGGRARQIDVEHLIDGDRRRMFVAAAAEISREGEDGIDDEFAGVIVGSNGESSALVAAQHEASFDRLLASCDFLVDARSFELHAAGLALND